MDLVLIPDAKLDDHRSIGQGVINVTRKCKLQASFYFSTDMVLHLFDPFEALVLCNSLRIILMLFNSIQEIMKWKNCKIDKHMELGLYRKPSINFQGSKSKETSQGMYVKILICSR